MTGVLLLPAGVLLSKLDYVFEDLLSGYGLLGVVFNEVLGRVVQADGLCSLSMVIIQPLFLKRGQLVSVYQRQLQWVIFVGKDQIVLHLDRTMDTGVQVLAFQVGIELELVRVI